MARGISFREFYLCTMADKFSAYFAMRSFASSPFAIVGLIVALFGAGLGVTAGITSLGQFTAKYFKAANPVRPRPDLLADEAVKPVVKPPRRLASQSASRRRLAPISRWTPEPATFDSTVPVTPEMTLEDVQDWVEAFGREHPGEIEVSSIGTSAEGRNLLCLKTTPSEVERRVLILCRQHGDEPETTLVGLRLIEYFLLNNSVRSERIRSKVSLVVIPLANPDGAAAGRRHNGLDQDLNRDWSQPQSPEIGAIRPFVMDWSPDLVVDVHQWVPGDSTQVPMAESGGGNFAAEMADTMALGARRAGFRLADNRSRTVDALAHRHLAGSGIPSVLLETIHTPGSSTQRRKAVDTSLAALQAALDRLSQG